MLDILTWMWHDPHLQGSRGVRGERTPEGGGLRPDLVMLNRRRAARLAKAGKPIPQQIIQVPTRAAHEPVGPQAPRFFKPEFIVRLAQLCRKHLKIPFRFVCITDEPQPNSADVTWMLTPAAALEAGQFRSPEGLRFPSCYRRLWAQSEEAARVLSERCLLIDADLVPLRDLAPIVERDEPFVGWRPYRDWGKQERIGGGIYLFKPGAHTKVWTEFMENPQAAIARARQAGFRGSDQAWLSYKLAGKVPVWGRDAGIYSIRDFGNDHRLPPDARLVQMNGPAHCKPWSYRGPATWVAEHCGSR